MASKHDIHRQILGLARKGFDHDGAQALPMRRDVLDYAAYHLFSAVPGSLDARLLAAAPEPDVMLNKDGTVELHFGEEGGKGLILTIQCAAITTWIKILEDGQTAIEGVHNLCTCDELEELGSLIEWLVA